MKIQHSMEGVPLMVTDSADKFIPVIVGVAQLLDRPVGDAVGLEPLSLLIKALTLADEDSGGLFLKLVDSIDIENITSRAYADISEIITQKLKLAPSRCVYQEVSGDLPIRNLCEAANRIANGESQVAVICGAESAWSVARAKRLNLNLESWVGQYKRPTSWIPEVDDVMRQYDLVLPVNVYALYENACRSQWRLSFTEAQYESGDIQSRASSVASNNEFAWSKLHKTAEEVVTPSSKNKMLAWPYTKLMVANNKINCGTAIIITNLQLAKALGYPLEKLIYINAGGYASEPDNIVNRDNFIHSAALEAVIERLLSANKVEIADIDYQEIYSCFPIVSKLAKRVLGVDGAQELTVTGGMTFCRGQLSNFMSQALVTMTAKLRASGKYGLLYGNGHYLTHASGVVISKQKPVENLLPINLSVQQAANAKMGIIPEFVEHFAGPARVETYTVVFDSENKPQLAIVVARNQLNQRFLAKTNTADPNAIAPFVDSALDVIGMSGNSTICNGYNIWHW